MARGRFVAAFYSNCANCEEVIEPGDEAGFVRGVDRAVCEDCFEELSAELDDYPEPTHWDDVR
jgi:hypothetical protein